MPKWLEDELHGKLAKLVAGAEAVLEEWDRGDEQAFRDAIEELRADVEEAKAKPKPPRDKNPWNNP
jgi:hemerythrin-like domain-containing protein